MVEKNTRFRNYVTSFKCVDLALWHPRDRLCGEELENIPLIIKHIEEKVKYFALSGSLLGLPMLIKRQVMHMSKINQYFSVQK